ncbi:branched-chain amino acid transaminase [Dechloromonas sp. XY25]|uniref:Branched-chain-amino-acid aminotransferase n=1 Tax=Dechloromonas hankyongensis TaxID=2908002 RepID=A0ABS9JXM6_9RHOO|nr:branched-chain amino acid transaminase [Dechloromonas hankyongensis]MCG2575667.1 branched-chain amino acid transaminase [Dechloromonas hankyongensis]
MQDRDGYIWLDGQWLPWREAKVHALTHTLHYGYGCFEGIRAYETAHGPAIFRLDEHLRRLQDSAHILAIDLPFDRAALAAVCREAVSRNGLRSAYIRPLVFLGAEKLGVDPAGADTHVMVAAWPWGAYLGGQAIEAGIRVRVSSYARHHPNVQMCRAKAISTYANSILAVREARRDGYDEALLLDTEGYVAEGSSENVFIVRDGEVLQPETTSALDGITRRTVETLAREAGLAVRAKRITRDEVYCADEVFLTGTAAEITPVVEVDGRRIGRGQPGAVTRRLQERYFACVKGEDVAHTDWLSAV